MAMDKNIRIEVTPEVREYIKNDERVARNLSRQFDRLTNKNSTSSKINRIVNTIMSRMTVYICKVLMVTFFVTAVTAIIGSAIKFLLWLLF